MKIEVLVTLKGNVGELYQKGDIFESPNIPDTLMMEIGAGIGTIRVIEEPVPVPPLEVLVEEDVLEELIEEPVLKPVVEPLPIPKVKSRLRKK
jgi:hypothetical protein